MTTPIKVVIDTKELERIAAQLDGNTDKVLQIVARRVEQGAKMLAPVDTGALRNSIMTEKMGENYWQVHDGVEYGIYQEFGTRYMAAHPFMTPAAEQAGGELNSGRLWEQLFRK